MSQRDIEYLNKRRIIYRRNPINDKPTEVYWWGDFYADGTYECYDLFRSKAKITTYKSLKWHMLVLWYLNPQLDKFQITQLAIFICNKENGFVTFFIKKNVIFAILDDIDRMGSFRPPKNRLRKVIFKDNTGLAISKKLSIVGKLIGRTKKIHQDDIYQCMIDMYDMGKKITIGNIAKLLDVSPRTVYRNMDEHLREEKIILNKENEKVRREQLRKV
jgi:hypothetical protein